MGDVVGSLPPGVSIQSASDTTVVLSVDSKDGDGQDGVGSFSATFEVTNVSAPNGPAQFKAEAKAVETTTGDGECDTTDNQPKVEDNADATVQDTLQLVLAATDSMGDEDDLSPHGSDKRAEERRVGAGGVHAGSTRVATEH